ncbi:hypothetical protein ADINL_2396 [Nitrincola lacisaponensis]|uniref:Uncharacterized protein n=1 Tax=Nitrincola lacisaponensis TaxID=267850 RepID=A0A063Y401_9GAMM|nr:DUF6482 family protein [Nitrincola lacisaponensis]KDE39267.1 hypothetical protein ADINL_2396 [Nitrincola lacisaponensis]
MKITLKQLQQGHPVKQLILQSMECELYLVNICDHTDQRWIVCDEQGKPLSYRSQLDAKKPFKGLGIQQTLLEHQSPYNEMIGIEPAQVAALQVRIANPDQDYS